MVRFSALDRCWGWKLRTNDDRVAGKITDLVLDLDAGRLAFVVVEGNKGVVGSADKLALPLGLFRDVATSHEPTLQGTPANWQAAPAIKVPQGEMTRKWAAGVFQSFGLSPYWNDKEQDASNADQLSSLSQLRNKAVRNGNGEPLGRINDFAATAGGEIAYAGLARTEKAERLYPIPLSAFIALPGSADWQLNLPKEILENTPTFASGAWPTTLDRGWVEYVHVRYGRSGFDGIERQQKADQKEKPAAP